ncbi:LOW QUALITY PROTEIN: EF-hand domain-containing family member B [Lampris incognitus]|uniref:LOW QUALITY PROTEIN: EF-hand domain-containing family member B n=1 Tax=Lampris incognitus TaxID=2546036 RepID=UPI0024B4D636|nr:LOW QUALITY PROTEIN: EF-hand domain-containing family member B [Lampris incognitus]
MASVAVLQKGEGAIDKEDLQEVCHQLQLELSELVLDNLMDYCDVDKDGLISFLEFSNFLNWKDRMPIDPQDQHILTSECRTSTAPANINSRSLAGSPEPVESKVLIKPEDLEPIEAGSSLKTPQTLSRLRTAPDHFVTSSQIRATDFSHSKTNYRTYGVPSVCTDFMVPRVKRISNTNNYGEESTSTDLLYPPPLYSLGGINEGHFLCPHPKEEIALIFRNVGVNIAKEMFEGVWKLASMKYPAGAVCVDTLHDVLKEIKVL